MRLAFGREIAKQPRHKPDQEATHRTTPLTRTTTGVIHRLSTEAGVVLSPYEPENNEPRLAAGAHVFQASVSWLVEIIVETHASNLAIDLRLAGEAAAGDSSQAYDRTRSAEILASKIIEQVLALQRPVVVQSKFRTAADRPAGPRVRAAAVRREEWRRREDGHAVG